MLKYDFKSKKVSHYVEITCFIIQIFKIEKENKNVLLSLESISIDGYKSPPLKW